MKKIFYLGLSALTLFEILNVYFIMPMPGSQKSESIDLAYFLYSYRWVFRILFGVITLTGIRSAFQIRWKWVPFIPILIWAGVTYLFNFKMTADHMFLQPTILTFKSNLENKVDSNAVVIGVVYNGEAKAYPIRYLIYHHQVEDVIGGNPIIVTYCSVCRTGAAFEPLVMGKLEKFRLVGMDHFNAMFEDYTTKSWWRQANGEAITGELKGKFLPQIHSKQITLKKWFELYPNGKVMQLDDASKGEVDLVGRYERGNTKGSLTRSDTLSWKDKSWIVGIQIGKSSKAYDWNLLKKSRIINDNVNNTPISIILSNDNMSFVAFERNSNEQFTIEKDIINYQNNKYNFAGEQINSSGNKLKPIQASQEFWHSWRTFHPNTEKY